MEHQGLQLGLRWDRSSRSPNSYRVVTDVLANAQVAGPVDVLACIDTSGSMSELTNAAGRPTRLQLIKDVIDRLLIGTLREQDRLAVVEFSDQAINVHQFWPMTHDNRAISRNLIQHLSDRNGTNMMSAVERIEHAAMEFRHNSANYVFLFTDGWDNQAEVHFMEPLQDSDAVERQMIARHNQDEQRRRDMRVYQINQRVAALKQRYQALAFHTVGCAAHDSVLLQRMADAGGGQYWLVNDPADIPVTLANLFRRLTTVAARTVRYRFTIDGGNIDVPTGLAYATNPSPALHVPVLEMWLGDLAIADHRHVPLFVNTTRPANHNLTIEIFWIDHVGVERRDMRVVRLDALDVATDDPLVDAHVQRVQAGHALRGCAENGIAGKSPAASERAIAVREAVSTAPAARTQLGRQLIEDLRQCAIILRLAPNGQLPVDDFARMMTLATFLLRESGQRPDLTPSPAIQQELQARQRAAQEAAAREQAERERLEREAREKAAREAAEREALRRAEEERRERERQQREKEREERERAALEEQARRSAEEAQRALQAQREREAREREAARQQQMQQQQPVYSPTTMMPPVGQGMYPGYVPTWPGAVPGDMSGMMYPNGTIPFQGAWPGYWASGTPGYPDPQQPYSGLYPAQQQYPQNTQQQQYQPQQQQQQQQLAGTGAGAANDPEALRNSLRRMSLNDIAQQQRAQQQVLQRQLSPTSAQSPQQSNIGLQTTGIDTQTDPDITDQRVLDARERARQSAIAYRRDKKGVQHGDAEQFVDSQARAVEDATVQNLDHPQQRQYRA